jgi:hypothetical protein
MLGGHCRTLAQTTVVRPIALGLLRRIGRRPRVAAAEGPDVERVLVEPETKVVAFPFNAVRAIRTPRIALRHGATPHVAPLRESPLASAAR